MSVLLLLSLFLWFTEMRCEGAEVGNTLNEQSQVCYGTLGCFTIGPPFISYNWPFTFLPQSPDLIRTHFLLYTRSSINTPQVLDARFLSSIPVAWTNFKVRPTNILIHGFIENIKLKTTWPEVIYEILKNGDYNVIFVDWSKGNLPPYTQATANTRVVGAQVAELMKELQEAVAIKPADFHIIGHSLGAHTAGYAGERVPGLGRITGLDPAGPYFENTDKQVRLDETDALFVDVIHSDATSLSQFGFGIKTLSGHLDFFPNLGHDQPGCEKNSIKNLQQYNIFEAVEETFVCNHMRSLRFFNESINSPCPFMAFPCDSEEDFENDLCHSCGKWGCQKMGFHAKKISPSFGHSAKYYLTTGDRPTFCRYHFIAICKFSARFGTALRGTLNLIINGDIYKFNRFTLTRNSMTFHHGQSYMFNLMLSEDFGNVQSVILSWKCASCTLNSPNLNIFDQSRKSLFLDEIDIYREETGIDARLCAGGQEVPSGGSLTVSKKCLDNVPQWRFLPASSSVSKCYRVGH